MNKTDKYCWLNVLKMSYLKKGNIKMYYLVEIII